jgi:hypothetical protein
MFRVEWISTLNYLELNVLPSHLPAVLTLLLNPIESTGVSDVCRTHPAVAQGCVRRNDT